MLVERSDDILLRDSELHPRMVMRLIFVWPWSSLPPFGEINFRAAGRSLKRLWLILVALEYLRQEQNHNTHHGHLDVGQLSTTIMIRNSADIISMRTALDLDISCDNSVSMITTTIS